MRGTALLLAMALAAGLAGCSTKTVKASRPSRESGWEVVDKRKIPAGSTSSLRLGQPVLDDRQLRIPAEYATVSNYRIEKQCRRTVEYDVTGCSVPSILLWELFMRPIAIVGYPVALLQYDREMLDKHYHTLGFYCSPDARVVDVVKETVNGVCGTDTVSERSGSRPAGKARVEFNGIDLGEIALESTSAGFEIPVNIEAIAGRVKLRQPNRFVVRYGGENGQADIPEALVADVGAKGGSAELAVDRAIRWRNAQGSDRAMAIAVRNTGRAPAYKVSVRVIVEKPSGISTNSYAFDVVPPGREAQVEIPFPGSTEGATVEVAAEGEGGVSARERIRL